MEDKNSITTAHSSARRQEVTNALHSRANMKLPRLRLGNAGLRKLTYVAEIFQVELHGRYSDTRVRELAAFTGRTTRAQAAIILFGTTVPCLIMPITVDLVGLAPPEEGPDRNWRFFLRVFVAWWFFSCLCINQCRHYVTSLYLGDFWLFTRAGVVGGGMAATAYLLATVVIGFPVPFTNVTTSAAWVVMLCAFIFFNWYRRIQAGTARGSSAEWKMEITTWLKVWTCQCLLLAIYPVYFFAFLSLPESGQLPFAFLLPVLKVLVRNWLSRALGSLHDEKTESVILNADVFSSLFVSYCMQTVPTGLTTAGLMTIDYLQLAVSTHNLSILIKRINGMRERLVEIRVKEKKQASDEEPQGSEQAAIAQQHQLPLTALGMANSLLVKRQRGAPNSNGEAAANSGENTGAQAAVTWRTAPTRSGSALGSTIVSAVKITPRLPGSLADAAGASCSLSTDPSRLERQLIDATRRLLYFTEFLVLLSFVEVIIPFIYGECHSSLLLPFGSCHSV